MQLQQDRLFVLIKSLTTGEKTYFAKYSRVHHAKEKPDYLRLFEFMDTQEEYDEKAVKKHFKKEKFIQQLPRKKTQLKEKIMESLSIFHADRNVETSLRRQMVLLPVLYEKAANHKDLIKDYEKQIKDIKTKAEEHECFSVLIELFEWERLLLKLLDDNKRKEKVFSLLQDRKSYKVKLNSELDLEDAATRTMQIILKDPKFKNNKNCKEFQNSVISILEGNKIDDLSIVGRRNYYFVKSAYHRYQSNWDLSYEVAKNHVSTYMKQDVAGILGYKEALCNYLFVSDVAEKYDDYVDILNELKKLSFKGDVKIFNTIQFKSLLYYLNNDDFKSAVEIAQKIEAKWDELCTFIPKRRQLAYHYNIIVAYWFAGNIKAALYWLSKILNFENSPEGQRFINLSRIIQLPLYYDCKDENLDNRIESARKTLNSRGVLNEYRKIIISYFRRLIRCVGKQEEKQCIIDMHFALAQIESEQNIKSGDLDCILLWCKSKVKDIKIAKELT